jgi:hypothetical protein
MFFTVSFLLSSNASFALKENCLNSDVVEQIYKRNPILRYTNHPLHSPLLPLPYGDINLNCKFAILPGSQRLWISVPLLTL